MITRREQATTNEELGQYFQYKNDLEREVIQGLRKQIKELNEDIPRLIQGNFNKITQNIMIRFRERKEELLKDILENGIKDSDIHKYE